jgi:phage/plasmid-like protein (TIGR03299 family)
MAETGDAYKVLGSDEVRGFLNIATSYDLSFSTRAYFTSVRVVCNNTLQQSFKNATNQVVIPHVREFDAEAVQEQMGLGRSQWDAWCQSLDIMAKCNVDSAKAKEVINKVFALDPANTEKYMADPDKVHADNVHYLFSGKGIAIDQTAWGLLNSFTEYIDHKKRARNVNNRLDSAWFGDGLKIKQTAYDECLALAA